MMSIAMMLIMFMNQPWFNQGSIRPSMPWLLRKFIRTTIFIDLWCGRRLIRGVGTFWFLIPMIRKNQLFRNRNSSENSGFWHLERRKVVIIGYKLSCQFRLTPQFHVDLRNLISLQVRFLPKSSIKDPFCWLCSFGYFSTDGIFGGVRPWLD